MSNFVERENLIDEMKRAREVDKAMSDIIRVVGSMYRHRVPNSKIIVLANPLVDTIHVNDALKEMQK